MVGVSTPAPDGKRFRGALWEIDPDGARPARRLTRSAPGESRAAFLRDGSVLFTSTRPDPDSDPGKPSGEDEPSRLWLLPAGGGEARLLASPPGGVEAIAAARSSSTVALRVSVFADAADWEDDSRRGDLRQKTGVGARLYEELPVRFWDHYLGPRHPRIAVATLDGAGEAGTLELRDLTGGAGHALEECEFDITPDGSTVITGWRSGPIWQQHLVAIDVATGATRVLARDDEFDVGSPACSPDGRRVAALVTTVGSPDRPFRAFVRVIDLATAEHHDFLSDADIQVEALTWTADSGALLVSADHHGTRPVWRVGVAGERAGALSALTDDASYEDVRALPDGRIAGVRSTASAPHHVAILDHGLVGTPPGPAEALEIPTRIEEIWVDAPDGRGRVQGWLHLPESASPEAQVPLVLFIHGGPIASFRGWSWRWSPHVLAAAGYAVLTVNPALSTGYGWENIDRAWGAWGPVVEKDLLAAVDAACAHPMVDATRVAAAGGSYGGFMANWLAGHTDRFRCLVTHASLYSLDQFHGTTDLGPWLEEEFGSPYEDPERYARDSPRTYLPAIVEHRTPMLIIHGELDARVPVAEGLRLFTDLRRLGVPARLLYFPDENHWILRPQNIRVWYATVLSFLGEHLRGEPFVRHELI